MTRIFLISMSEVYGSVFEIKVAFGQTVCMAVIRKHMEISAWFTDSMVSCVRSLYCPQAVPYSIFSLSSCSSFAVQLKSK